MGIHSIPCPGWYDPSCGPFRKAPYQAEVQHQGRHQQQRGFVFTKKKFQETYFLGPFGYVGQIFWSTTNKNFIKQHMVLIYSDPHDDEIGIE